MTPGLIEEATEAAKAANNLKPITLFAVISIGLIGFLVWLNVRGVETIKEDVRNTQGLLNLHQSSQQQIHDQLRYQTLIMRETCINGARTAGRDEKACY